MESKQHQEFLCCTHKWRSAESRHDRETKGKGKQSIPKSFGCVCGYKR